DFYNFCCDKGRKYNAFDTLEKERRSLLSNNTRLEITDYGAGSKVFTSNQRSISQIAKTSLKSGKQAQLLFRLNVFLKAERVLELGTSLGLTAAYLSKSASQVVTIEGDESIHLEAKKLFQKLNLKNVDALNGEFEKVIPNLSGKFDLIFIDGHHDGDATLNYLDILYPMLSAQGCFVLDDIRWSKSMNEAWKHASFDERFNASVDLFEMGILFKQPGQTKENFVVRY
ncbi:MAG: O-methyltransferase, partial [Flavobacteriales bacterium]